MKRILFVLNSFSLGGAENVAVSIIKNLSKSLNLLLLSKRRQY